MKNILFIALLVMPFYSSAGATVPPPQRVYVDKVTSPDGRDLEWAQGERLASVVFTDLAAEIRVSRFTNTYYFEDEPGTIKSSSRTGLFFEFKNSEDFTLGDEAIFEVKFLTPDRSRFVTHRSCHTKVVFGGPNQETCETKFVKHSIKITRDSKGALRLKSDSDDFLSYGYKKSGGREYFEVFSTIDLMTHWNLKDKDAVPYIVLTAFNANSNSSKSVEAPAVLAKYTGVQNAAKVWDVYKPTVESYIRDSNRPDIRPVVQVGVSVQVRQVEVAGTVTSNFKDIDVAFSGGVAISNTDLEINASVMGFATDSLESVTSGTSTTVSGELGSAVNVGGALSYNSNNELFGAGISVGFGSAIDVDLSVTESTVVYTTRTSSDESDRGDGNRRDGYNEREGRTSRVDGEGGRSIEH